MITFVDRNREMVRAWEDAFSHLEGKDRDGFKIVEGSIFDVGATAIVSPANSFGFMDGGLDQAILDNLGQRLSGGVWDIQDKLQAQIRYEFGGELLVGQATLVRTSSDKIPFVIAAPTMRVPMDITGTINAYLAMRAIILFLRKWSLSGGHGHASLKSQDIIAVPGLGTGIGKMPFRTCARQMYVAYAYFALEKWNEPKTWYEAQKMDRMLKD